MKMDVSYLGNLSRALDAYSMRNEAINSNIANVSTPNYKRKEVKFEEYLKKSYNDITLKGFKTNLRHMDIPSIIDKKAFTTIDNSVSTREDKNNVNVDVEEVDSVKNFINYSMVSDSISTYFKAMLTGITGGKK